MTESCPDTEIIDWYAYASDGYRMTDETATAKTAAEERWVVAEYSINDEGEYVYDALIEPTTLDEAQDYQEHRELNLLIAEAESTDDYEARERIIDEIGPLVREQIATA